MKTEIQEEIEAYKRELLDDALSQCTPEQQEFFQRLYPKGPGPNEIEWAIQQCRNSIKKNKAVAVSITIKHQI